MKRFGLLGFPLGHSFSKSFFEKKFASENLTDCRYDNYEIELLATLPNGLSGMNVTIPHKQTVIPLLRSIDPVALAVGAVNCVDHNLRGYNTDVIGFSKSLQHLIGTERPRALVLGTGGAARAVAYVLSELGIEFRYVSRSGELNYDNLSSEIVAEHRLIINTSPVGMFPNISGTPNLPYDALGEDHYLFDLVYNPAQTRFLYEGRVRGAWVKSGVEMLYEQAEAAWEIWNRDEF